MSNGKQTVQFLKVWDKYVAGDIAGFAPKLARSLKDQGFAEDYDPSKVKAQAATVSLELDTSKARQMINEASEEFAERDKDLTARENKLSADEGDLAARLADIEKREQALADKEAASTETAKAEPEKADEAPGAPPKQGAKQGTKK